MQFLALKSRNVLVPTASDPSRLPAAEAIVGPGKDAQGNVGREKEKGKQSRDCGSVQTFTVSD